MRIQRNEPRSIVLPLAVALAGLALIAAPPPATAKPPACKAVFGVGDLSVAQWMDGEPFVVAGEFNVAIDTLERMALYLDSDPGQLIWFDGTLTLMAMPGSDAPLPGDLAWAPCSSTWRLSRGSNEYVVESFCESIMAPDPGPRYFELFVRDEIAAIEPASSGLDCGRLHLNGTWDADLDIAEEVTVAGKLCNCP